MDKIIGRRLFTGLLLLVGGLTVCSRVAARPCETRVTLTVIAHAPSWVRMRVDGCASAYSGIMRPGQIVERRGRRIIVIETGNAGGITVKLNGRKLAPLGRSGQPVVRRYTPPPAPVVTAAPVAPPPMPTPAPKPPVRVQPTLKPLVVLPVPEVHSPATAKGFPPHVSLYASLALLTVALFVFIWMLAAMRREGRLLASLGIAAGSDASIRVVKTHRLSRGRTVYVLEAGGRLFLVATGGVVLLGEIAPGTTLL
jgi:hypothetical protein